MLHEADILRARILIVDDQSAHALLLERVLLDAGYLHVSTTLDPQQVCRLYREDQHDLILLDLQMPVLDGFGVMEALRAERGDGSGSSLPVIALTAQPGHKLRALQAGARDYINKPFDMLEVKLRIHHMLEVRLLQKALKAHNQDLERQVQARTAELRDSESRYRSLTELAAEWYWEQNDVGEFIRVHGPVMEMLDLDAPGPEDSGRGQSGSIWDAAERQTLRDLIAARQPFIDFLLHRVRADGSRQQFRMSGEPVFDGNCRVTGYRGVGVEVLAAR